MLVTNRSSPTSWTLSPTASVSFFQPVLPIALSLTLLLTGYICLMVGLEQLENNTERGIAGTMGVVLAVYGAGWGLATGAVLYFLIERTKLLGFTADPEAPGVKAAEEH